LVGAEAAAARLGGLVMMTSDPSAKDAPRYVRLADVERALHCSLHREHAVAGMLGYSLRHVMDDEQIARVMLASWPRYPDPVALGQALRLV